ncbi:MAG TPA: imelysin family protein [Methylomirabilota bacterium]|jgi:predicted lipoprotein
MRRIARVPRTVRAAAVLALAVLAGTLARAAAAEEPDRDPAYRRLNVSLVEHHVLPRYARLAASAAALDVAARRFCAAPAATPLDEVRSAFHVAADAWHDVEHLRLGPIESRLRADRFSFWPDPRNATGRQLGELLAGRDPAGLTVEGFARASAAVQGLPAAERLLFDESAAAAFRRSGEEARRRCGVLEAITRNVGGIAAEVAREWSTGEASYARRVATAGPGNVTYPEVRDATQDLLKSLYGVLERVASLKLAKPLGASAAMARPALAEEWRSGRALRDLRLNLAAARALYLGDGGFGMSDFVRDVAGEPELDARLRRGFAACLEAADGVPVPLEAAVGSRGGRPAVERLLAEVRDLSHTVAEHLTTALDLPLGFNALDGD